MKLKESYQFFYYQSKHFESLFKIYVEFDFIINPQKRQKKDFDIEKYNQEERGYLKENTSDKYYRFYLCILKQEVIGFTWFGQSDDNRNEGFIQELYVKPKYRKRGIATKLLLEGFKWIKAKSCPLVEIIVPTEQKNAIKLYNKMGFIKQKQEPTFFIMKKELN